MKITASAISLNVADETASARFLTEHFGFVEEMADDGFVSLRRDDAGFNIVFLRTGKESFRPASHAASAKDGLLIVFVVDDIDVEWVRLSKTDIPVATPIETEPWGERYFQVLDPNGVVIQLVQWV